MEYTHSGKHVCFWAKTWGKHFHSAAGVEIKVITEVVHSKCTEGVRVRLFLARACCGLGTIKVTRAPEGNVQVTRAPHMRSRARILTWPQPWMHAWVGVSAPARRQTRVTVLMTQRQRTCFWAQRLDFRIVRPEGLLMTSRAPKILLKPTWTLHWQWAGDELAPSVYVRVYQQPD